METNKAARFWETEKELSKLLTTAKNQLETTQHVLITQLPVIKELFQQLTQLSKELGYYENSGNELIHMADSLPSNVETENGRQE